MSVVYEMPNNNGSSYRQDVAARLRQAIAARRIKKSSVASVIGMNPTSFSKRVNGHLPMDLDEVDIIAAVAGIMRDWLMSEVGPMLDPEWVPPAGIEPAAFCSQEGPTTPDLASVLPFPGNRSPNALPRWVISHIPVKEETGGDAKLITMHR